MSYESARVFSIFTSKGRREKVCVWTEATLKKNIQGMFFISQIEDCVHSVRQRFILVQNSVVECHGYLKKCFRQDSLKSKWKKIVRFWSKGNLEKTFRRTFMVSLNIRGRHPH